MMTNIALKYVYEAKTMTKNLGHLVDGIVQEGVIRENYYYITPVYQRISALNAQIASLEVYMEEIEYCLEWRELICSQVRFVVTTLVGSVIGILLTHIF